MIGPANGSNTRSEMVRQADMSWRMQGTTWICQQLRDVEHFVWKDSLREFVGQILILKIQGYQTPMLQASIHIPAQNDICGHSGIDCAFLGGIQDAMAYVCDDEALLLTCSATDPASHNLEPVLLEVSKQVREQAVTE
ncbi:hypothetical protein WOLCODRAFT_19335 [Wolfiporia cocos MD-104 SS10]|uniref:Uncharacterized protein n=1 Tax=Wolfiporia cocos (strain MD-104) TaxID=742152 RepID=A0A2H3K7K2_WOLCO|nr:hypothetical protein WOLCODRAFT_19335 [Wolfiporia cocos MD-104 SS10]